MSKKRNKNQRKKQVRKQPKKRRDERTSASPARGATDLDARWEADYKAPEVQEPATGVGGIGRMRALMKHSEEGPDAGMLYKRRGWGEISIWVGAGVGICWLILHVFDS